MSSNVRNIYFYLHMPKCGGTTLHSVLAKEIEKCIYFDGMQRVEDFKKSDWENVNFVGGHLTPDFKSLLGDNVKVTEFTVLREPIKRYISHYNYYKEFASKLIDRFNNIDLFQGHEKNVIIYQKELYKRLTTKTFDEIIDDELFARETYNLYTRMLILEPNKYYSFDVSELPKLNDADVETALQRLDKMEFIGLTEDMDTTFLIASEALNILPYKSFKENVTTNNEIKLENLSSETIEKIKTKLEYDYIVYEHAKKLFNEKKAKISEEKVFKKYVSQNYKSNSKKIVNVLKDNLSGKLSNRIKFVKETIKDKNSRILELGPLNNPIVTKEEYPNCFYGDIRSTEQVKELYTSNDYLNLTGIYVNPNDIVDIDYVLKDTYANSFKEDEKFDYIIASHVLEHIDDLIFFLRDVSTALKDNGKICILYPDKRYCFDHFRESASFRDAYDVFSRGRKENARMVLDFYNTVIDENNPAIFWHSDNLESLLPSNDVEMAINAYKKALGGERPDDVHYWPFTDESFLRFIYDCIRANLLPYSCVNFCPTGEGTQEFHIVLELNNSVLDDNNNELSWLSALIGAVPNEHSSNIKLKQEMLQLEGTTSNQQNMIVELQNITSNQQNTIVELQNITSNQQNTIMGLQNTITELQDILKSVYDSNSWKITNPIRAVTRRIKKSLKK